jgi:hypothetical protein
MCASLNRVHDVPAPSRVLVSVCMGVAVAICATGVRGVVVRVIALTMPSPKLEGALEM